MYESILWILQSSTHKHYRQNTLNAPVEEGMGNRNMFALLIKLEDINELNKVQ